MKLKQVTIAFLAAFILLPMFLFGQTKIGYIASERVRAEFEEFKEAESLLQVEFRKVKKSIK